MLLLALLEAAGVAKLGAGLGAGIAAIGAGLGIGRIGSSAMEAIARPCRRCSSLRSNRMSALLVHLIHHQNEAILCHPY